MAHTVGMAQSVLPTEADRGEEEITINMTYTVALATFSLDSINLNSLPPRQSHRAGMTPFDAARKAGN